MKKTLLLGLLAIGFNSFGQGGTTCAAPTVISANGTYSIGDLTMGTYPSETVCFAGNDSAAPHARWFRYTPSLSGILTVTSDIAANIAGADTRLSLLTGSCAGPWTCVSSNDDVSGSNYRSAITNVAVTAGTAYYILWDNNWEDDNYSFELTFTPATCFAPAPTDFYLPEYVSTTEANLYWDQASPQPANYDVDWSNDFSTPVESGTMITAASGALAYSTANIASIPASTNFRYFVRGNCGPSDKSTWAGPFYGYLPVGLPYSNDFESAANNYTDGFAGQFATFNSTGTTTPANYADGGAGVAMYTFNSTTAQSDRRGYFRGMELASGEVVTVSFKTRLYSTATVSPMAFDLTVGDSQSAAGQATVVQSFTNNSDASYVTHTATFTAPTPGIYYFGIHNNSAVGATETFLFLDTITLDTNLSTDNFNSSSANISIYPNPVNDVLNISSPDFELQSVTVTDINGRIVKDSKANNTNVEMNVSDLNSGVYFINVKTIDGSVVKKFIKN
jgi:hypothetical protein